MEGMVIGTNSETHTWTIRGEESYHMPKEEGGEWETVSFVAGLRQISYIGKMSEIDFSPTTHH
jgi:hypothetical protein